MQRRGRNYTVARVLVAKGRLLCREHSNLRGYGQDREVESKHRLLYETAAFRRRFNPSPADQHGNFPQCDVAARQGPVGKAASDLGSGVLSEPAGRQGRVNNGTGVKQDHAKPPRAHPAER